MLKISESTPAATSASTCGHDLGGLADDELLLELVAHQPRQEAAHACGLVGVGGEHERAHPGRRDLGRVAADVGAVVAQHLELVRERRRAAGDVAHVGVLRDEAQRAALAAAPDHDRRPARLAAAGARCGRPRSGSSGP